MIDRTDLFQAALDSLQDGVALFGGDGEVIFWNQAALTITGFPAIELISQPVPESLEPLLIPTHTSHIAPDGPILHDTQRCVIFIRHKQGHPLAVVARAHVLRDVLGERIGFGTLFHIADGLESLPQVEGTGDHSLEDSRADQEERLHSALDELVVGGAPFGVLLISVDQAHELRKTHGPGACYAMLAKVRHALSQGLRPSEEIGRWDEDEFLVHAVARDADSLLREAQKLAGLARTADFRWWGDRLSITVSIGAACVSGVEGESLVQLLSRVRQAMENASQAGGNRAVLAPGRLVCSPS